MNTILSNLFPEDIYKDFVPMPESVTGWGGRAHVFGNLVRTLKPKVIVEVGSWKGQSAITMAEACREIGLDSAIICVDTWLGSIEHILHHPKELRRCNGYPTMYFQFLSNVIHRGMQEWIVPFPATSCAAAAILDQMNIRANLIYIDASHQYEDVLLDLKKYSDLLAKGGIMFGHDYDLKPVQRALKSFRKSKNFECEAVGNFWMLKE